MPDAAAVQLRKTLEAAAAHKGIVERNLATAVTKLLADGYSNGTFEATIGFNAVEGSGINVCTASGTVDASKLSLAGFIDI